MYLGDFDNTEFAVRIVKEPSAEQPRHLMGLRPLSSDA
jgi:hypothetical protein